MKKVKTEAVETGIVVSLKRVPDHAMYLKQAQADGKFENGPKFNLDSVIPAGSLLVRFEDGSQFIVQHNDVLQAAYEAWRKETGK